MLAVAWSVYKCVARALIIIFIVSLILPLKRYNIGIIFAAFDFFFPEDVGAALPHRNDI
jgi:hypothetical protein